MQRFVGLVVVALAVGVASGCAMKSELDVERARADRLGRALSQQRILSADLKKRLDAAQSELSGLKATMGDRSAKMARMAKGLAKLAEYEKMLAAQKALNDELKRAFGKMISAGNLKIVRRGDRLVLALPSKFLFFPGRADVARWGIPRLVQVAKILKGIKRHFQIAGHTDNAALGPAQKKKFTDNWQLSAMRAVNVLRELAKAGVPGINLSAAGYGKFQPAYTNRTGWGKMNNRRIEITLYPALPRLAQ